MSDLNINTFCWNKFSISLNASLVLKPKIWYNTASVACSPQVQKILDYIPGRVNQPLLNCCVCVFG